MDPDKDLNQTPQSQPTNQVSSTPNKEGAPVRVSEAGVIASQPELNIPNEVREIGVEAVPEAPVLSGQDFTAGLQHSGPAVPVRTEPEGTVTVPGLHLTKEEAQSASKGDISNSRTWLATLAVMVYQKVQRLKLKGAKV